MPDWRSHGDGRRGRAPRAAACLLLALLVAGCSGAQSALAPAGIEGRRLAEFFWIMLAGAGVIWTFVILLAIYLTRLRPEPQSPRLSRGLLIFGAVFPTVTLLVLLSYGLWLMPSLRAGDGVLTVEVTGKQFWWEIVYEPPEAGGAPIVSANEIRLPANRRVEFILKSPDVIHSFWIPALGGKLDMTPGRTTRLLLEPDQPGVYRGVCAEFCGPSHAQMAFSVVVMEEAEFDAWLRAEAEPAAPPASETVAAGQEGFLAAGCGGCHQVRGTEAAGRLGPDLTHFGSRTTLGAGILPNEREELVRWLAHTREIKPGAQMPSFGMLPDGELEAIARYLESLE